MIYNQGGIFYRLHRLICWLYCLRTLLLGDVDTSPVTTVFDVVSFWHDFRLVHILLRTMGFLMAIMKLVPFEDTRIFGVVELRLTCLLSRRQRSFGDLFGILFHGENLHLATDAATDEFLALTIWGVSFVHVPLSAICAARWQLSFLKILRCVGNVSAAPRVSAVERACFRWSYIILLTTTKKEIFTSLELCRLAYHQEGGDFRKDFFWDFGKDFLLEFWELPKYCRYCRRGRCCHFGLLYCSTVEIFTDPTSFQSGSLWLFVVSWRLSAASLPPFRRHSP